MAMKKNPIILLFLLFGGLLNACSNVTSSTYQITPSPIFSSTPARTKSIPSQINTPTNVRYTSTPRPTITSTPTFLSTLTPLPTLDAIKAHSNILNLLYDEKCKLPCFMGITVGETKGLEALQYLQSFSASIEGGSMVFSYEQNNKRFQRELYSVSITAQELGIFFSFGIRNDNLVDIMGLTSIKISGISIFSLDKLLTASGIPDDIRILSAPDYGANGYLPFAVEIGYRSTGIYALFVTYATKNGNEISACFKDSQTIVIYLTNPTNLQDYLSNFNQDSLPIEEALEIDNEAFYLKYRSFNNPLCMKTKAELWKP